jgi:arsenate reductase (thioredoxin)
VLPMRDLPPDEPYNVLFLCTGNSTRSIIAEVLLNKYGEGKFKAYSAGSYPKGELNPRTRAMLERFGYSTEDLRSKSWDEFAGPNAPELDFVFTVCDDAANEVCPIWPGTPITAHWGVADPTRAQGSDEEIAAAFLDAYLLLRLRIELLTNLPTRNLDHIALRRHLHEIGKAVHKADA